MTKAAQRAGIDRAKVLAERVYRGRKPSFTRAQLEEVRNLLATTLREIVSFGEGLVGRLLMIDARSMRFETLSYQWDPTNPLSGVKPTIADLSGHGA